MKMVDFNNETTVGRPAIDIVRVLILQRRSDLFEAWEFYKKKESDGVERGFPTVKTRLFSLFLELQPMFKRRLKEENYEYLIKLIESDDEKDILEAIYKINEELDDINLIKMDTKKSYDKTSWETENREMNL